MGRPLTGVVEGAERVCACGDEAEPPRPMRMTHPEPPGFMTHAYDRDTWLHSVCAWSPRRVMGDPEYSSRIGCTCGGERVYIYLSIYGVGLPHYQPFILAAIVTRPRNCKSLSYKTHAHKYAYQQHWAARVSSRA